MKILKIPKIKTEVCRRCYTVVSLEHKDLKYKKPSYDINFNAIIASCDDCYWKCPVCKKLNRLSYAQFYYEKKVCKHD